jgi:ferredoxin
MYGTIPGGMRVKYHGQHVGKEDFSQLVTDVFSAVRPQLNIMDSIEAMEGEGPSSGSMRKLGLILASEDAVALDAVASGIIGLDPSDVPTTRFSDERVLGIGSLGRIDVVGEGIQSVMVPDFRQSAIAARDLSGSVPRFLVEFVWRQVSVRPHVIERHCTGCLECERACPVDAVTVSDEIARIDYDACVKCMCCHEVCRFDAIVPRRPRIAGAIRWLVGILRKRSVASP